MVLYEYGMCRNLIGVKAMSKKTHKAQATTTLPNAGGLADAVKAAGEAAPKAEPKAQTVALRGGPAVALVTTAGAKAYRVAAKHNADWYGQMQSACKDGPAKVAELIEAGVPSHFVAYCLRKGYAVNADVKSEA
jgi:hypothetical protein